MENKKSLVEEAIIQIKNLEDVVAENAKGILQSTMKEEINQLVKESLTEQDEEGDEIEDTDVDSEDMDDDVELDDMEEDEPDNLEDDEMDSEFMNDEEEPVIDLTGEEDTDEVLRVFQLMGPDDEIIVQKDNSNNISLKDNKTNKEYMIVQESEKGFNYESENELYEFEDEDEDDEFEFSNDDDNEDEDEDVKSIIDKVFSTNERYEKDDEDIVDFGDDEEDEDEDDIVYEIEMDDDEMEMGMEDDEDYEEEEDESYDLDSVMEAKSFKSKGLGLGNPNKKKIYSAKPNQEGGFKTVKKTANKTMGTGSAKKGFSYKDGENLDGEFKLKPKTKKVETKEAARTYGNGSKSGRGLRKGITPNRNLNLENVNSSEVKVLREKNEEYRQALNVFRNKLTEVAVFNSNLAYATRLFTEHTTTKNEKINILKRFDTVETIKESKNLYQVIKDELSNTKTQPMNESIERNLNKVPSTGSAVNLIESKTYENPQFLRMKDLMTKLR
jgi:hypothetical protein